MALAVALAVGPALAEEPTQGMKRSRDGGDAVTATPIASTAPVQNAVERLRWRLRLHPGHDSLDVAEATRLRPHPQTQRE